ncbi:MAG TPA: hypothetical protein DCR94_04290 [Firmicutes bacterium]|nr:hypothetical protein [Bacillota bacterium]
MISNERKNELSKSASIISMFLDTVYPNKTYVYGELQQKIKDEMNGRFRPLVDKCTEEEKEYIVGVILESKDIVFEKVEQLVDDENRSWFTDDKDRRNLFFDRYGRYLQREKHFGEKALKSLSEDVLNPIMNQLGNPKATESFERYGLIIGDVQSGKTLNYIGMINKAADAGYKIIIVLTGTIETLRKQTQGRIDEGFVGYDSDSTVKKEEKIIGVGEDSLTKKERQAASFTTKESDFDGKIANSLGISMNMLKTPVVIVAKKNVKILQRIYDWLNDNNKKSGGKINHPLLLIDDEADNASINTRDEDDNPTRTNASIRKLLFLFSKYTYVGYTATPYANIFINPDVYDENLGHDLFPRDFIFNLTPGEEYIGGKDIFLDDAKYHNALIKNDDCEEVLPQNHKKDYWLNGIPESLKDALILFALSNVIRDLRGDEHAHRSMLINISRFICMHDEIKDYVHSAFTSLLDSYFTYGKAAEDDKNLERTHKLYDEQYASARNKYPWYEIKCKLYDSNKNVQFVSVNSDNDMIDYKDYADEGARAIFIGGMSLSRGLTLEGLCISYFYRYSKTYDVLFQMGRWFGYRKNYEDLFRIFMPSELMDWYETITESNEQLRIDLIKMQKAMKKPIDFGIRVMNDSTKLKITNPGKMRTAITDYETVIGFGEVIPTPDIYVDVNINKENMTTVFDLLKNDIYHNGLKVENDLITGNKCIKDVSLATIEGIVNKTQFSPANDVYDKSAVIDFLNKDKNGYFDKWDVVFVEGSKKTNSNLYHIEQLGIDIHKPRKKFDVYYNYLRMQCGREQLHNPTDTSACLNSIQEKNKLDEEFLELYKRTHPCKEKQAKKPITPAKQYLDTDDRNPLLMIFLVDLSEDEIGDREKQAIENFKKANIVPFGIALGIPKYTDEVSDVTTYKINVVEQRKRRERENYTNEDTYYEEEYK